MSEEIKKNEEVKPEETKNKTQEQTVKEISPPETEVPTTQEIIPAPPPEQITELPIDHLVKVAEYGEKHIALIKKILTLCLKITNIHDWFDFGGRPYLAASGCEKIARLFGISWKIVDFEKETFDDNHYIFYYAGEFTMKDIKIVAIGARSSRDSFFRIRYTKDGQRIVIPPKEVDEADVKKAAYTNCIARGIKQILGLGNITWGMLKEAGLPVEKITQIEFKKPPPEVKKSSQTESQK